MGTSKHPVQIVLIAAPVLHFRPRIGTKAVARIMIKFRTMIGVFGQISW